jgi:hypothetical protein
VIDSPVRCTAAFLALQALHVAGFVHGDARLPNLLSRGRGAGADLVWIDLRAAAVGAHARAQRVDARTLAASVLGTAPDIALPAPVDAALAAVPSDSEADSEAARDAYVKLAAAVWAGFGAA